MKLKKDQVIEISKLILNDLIAKNIITLKTDHDTLLEKVVSAFLKDLMIEDTLNNEIKELLKAHSYEIEQGRLDYQKMFNMIKQKLIKERKLVI